MGGGSILEDGAETLPAKKWQMLKLNCRIKSTMTRRRAKTGDWTLEAGGEFNLTGRPASGQEDFAEDSYSWRFEMETRSTGFSRPEPDTLRDLLTFCRFGYSAFCLWTLALQLQEVLCKERIRSYLKKLKPLQIIGLLS